MNSKKKSAKTLSRPPTIAGPNTATNSLENELQLEVEICWCVQRLESALNSGQLNQRTAEDVAKNIKILKSSTAPIVKKRQVMKAALGDYRSKMKDEERKMALAAKQIKFTPTDANKKFNFVKKSALLQSGKDFRFDFKPDLVHENGESSNDEQISKNLVTDPNVVGNTKTFISSDLNLNTGGNFKFNFNVEEPNNEVSLSGLSIKNVNE